MVGKDKLIIFIKNPVKGKVKTRLAATIGEERALEIYEILLKRTRDITQELPQEKLLYYSNSINKNDEWKNDVYSKEIQKGRDLGKRMLRAFKQTFDKDTHSVCIIGSDCYQLTSELIQNAFDRLQDHDLVIGPSLDGGYYLLGMKKAHNSLFKNIKWSTETVMMDTLKAAVKLKLKVIVLPFLQDVDTDKDLETMK